MIVEDERETPMAYQMEIYMYKGANHPRWHDFQKAQSTDLQKFLKKTCEFMIKVPIAVSRRI
jgi:hypothetical protein